MRQIFEDKGELIIFLLTSFFYTKKNILEWEKRGILVQNAVLEQQKLLNTY